MTRILAAALALSLFAAAGAASAEPMHHGWRHHGWHHHHHMHGWRHHHR